MANNIEQQGIIGEVALNQWLQEQKLSYIAICQAKETFSPMFSGDVKRPDFLLLLEGVGLIAVDAKNYKYSGGVYTLELEEELKRSIAFERLFRMPLWYAYYDESDGDISWYWISALKAVEVGSVRKSDKNNKEFLAIKREHFEHISTMKDISKLYTHRLPGATKIAALPLNLANVSSF
jgi:hypothetical protein